MEEKVNSSNADSPESVQRNYARAYRFAWTMMVLLAFVGSMIAELALDNLVASMMLGALSLIGVITEDLYLTWIFKDTPQPFEKRTSRPLWKVLSVLSIMLVWLLSDNAEGQLSVRALVFALVSGCGLAIFLWWPQGRFHSTSGLVQEMIEPLEKASNQV